MFLFLEVFTSCLVACAGVFSVLSVSRTLECLSGSARIIGGSADRDNSLRHVCVRSEGFHTVPTNYLSRQRINILCFYLKKKA